MNRCQNCKNINVRILAKIFEKSASDHSKFVKADAKINVQRCLDSDTKSYRNVGEIMANPSKINDIHPKIKSKRHQNLPKYVLGPFSAPNRAHVGSRTRRAVGGTPPFGAFWAESGGQGALFCMPWGHKIS